FNWAGMQRSFDPLSSYHVDMWAFSLLSLGVGDGYDMINLMSGSISSRWIMQF
ncbi:hypothetical protein ACJX0J_022500, partial [Zea mays]